MLGGGRQPQPVRGDRFRKANLGAGQDPIPSRSQAKRQIAVQYIEAENGEQGSGIGMMLGCRLSPARTGHISGTEETSRRNHVNAPLWVIIPPSLFAAIGPVRD